MARRSWVWCVKKHDWVPAEIFYANRQRAAGAYVIKDIAEYRSVATGEMISGRRQHREHLRANGLAEVGNEKNFASAKPKLDRPGHDLKRVLEQHGY